MKLIVGLGNPGKEYEKTRHNAGFIAIDILESILPQASGWTLQRNFHAEIAEGYAHNEKIILAKPNTYMNLSGEAVQELASYYKIPTEHILILHDELDIPPGKILFIAKGSPAGHKGIQSIQALLGTQAIQRLRIGIGRPELPHTTENWVLGRIDELTKEVCTHAADAALDWISKGIDAAMNDWN